MIRLPICFDPQEKHTPQRGGRFRVIPIFALILLFALSSITYAQGNKARTSKPEKPDVLIVVLAGIGTEDNVAMDYSTQTSPQIVTQDITRLQELTGWRISGAQAFTEEPRAAGVKPTTGAMFSAPGIVITQQGTLPIEPFVTVLKRFHAIEIDYIVSPQFTYRGLKDFENDYVKIKMRQTGTTYRFLVTVKNSDFEKLDLPVTQAEQKQRSEAMSTRAKIGIIVGLALLAALTVFLIMYFAGRNQQQR